jgi:hypothetical protein
MEGRESAMPQDEFTGEAGRTFGRETAPLIARAIGATMLGSESNEATYRGRHIVIKCARRNTGKVGVTYRMLERVDTVVGAFQQTDGSFEVILLPATILVEKMKSNRRKVAPAGEQYFISHGVFKTKGTYIGTVHL